MRTWLTHWLAAHLSPAEQDAVLGDAAERGTPPLRDVVSVLVWREARAWRTSSPWIALVTLVVPLGFVLSVVARAWASGFALFFWSYANNWTWGYLTNPGARHDVVVDFVAPTSLHIVCLVLWSWTVGRALQTLSRGTVGSNAVMLTAVVLMGTLGTTTLAMLNPANALAFSSEFYRVGIPLIARMAFVLVPMWWGAFGSDNAGWRWTVARTAVTTLLIAVMFRQVAGALFLGWVPTSVVDSHFGTTLFWWTAKVGGWGIIPPLLFPFVLAWPPAYLLIQARRRRLTAA